MTTALVFVHQNGSVFKQFKVVDASLTDAAISVINRAHHDHFVNGSLCQIASLEVYRGRSSNQTTEISYAGFSLSENGIVEVKV